MEVTARVEKTGATAKVNYDFGDTLGAMVGLFGEDVVFRNAQKSLVIELQSRLRRQLNGEKPKSAEEIRADTSAWKPGVSSTVRKSASEKAKDAIGKLSPEEKKTLLRELRTQA